MLHGGGVSRGVTSLVAVIRATRQLSAKRHDLADLVARGHPYVSADARDRPELARKYGVTLVPTVVRVAADGPVLKRMAG